MSLIFDDGGQTVTLLPKYTATPSGELEKIDRAGGDGLLGMLPAVGTAEELREHLERYTTTAEPQRITVNPVPDDEEPAEGSGSLADRMPTALLLAGAGVGLYFVLRRVG